MRKYRTSQKVWAVLLSLVMVLGMIPPVTVTAVGADAVVRTADPSTMNDYEALFLNPDTIGVELTTENAGGVWTDKSVFAANAVPGELTGAVSEIGSTIPMVDTGDNFLVALSAIASNKEIVGYSTRPTDTMLVLDLSGSMSGSTSAMVNAANKAIGDLLALNQHNRVGVVLYSGSNSFGNSDRNTATVLMPLGRYTTTSYTGNGANRVPQYIRSNNSEEVSVASGVTPRTNLGSAKDTIGGTYTQNGIYKAMNQLVNADEKVIADGSLQAGTTRLPIMVLMTDGEPSAATKNYTNIETSNVGNGETGTAIANDMAFLTQLTMAYAKREIDTAYDTESLVYTLGYSVDNNDYARSVLDPAAYTTNRINTLWNTFNNTAAGGTFQIQARQGQGTTVTKHTDAAGKYAKELKDYRYYTDEYFPASRQSDLTAAFQSIVDEIILQSKYYPTFVEKDYDHDGYITFTDKIGGYMEVTDVKGIVIGDTLYSGEKLAKGFSEGGIFGSVENPSELGDNLVWSVMERLHIDSAATARSLLNNAYNYGQMGVAADGSWSNYVGWYSDETGKYLDFYDESLAAAVPAGATHIIKSYLMLGQTDTAHGISAQDMMYASIRITQELGDYDGDGITGETFLTWKIPASLIPTITYQVTVETDAAGEIANVTKVELENANVKPIRLLYEVELREDIHEWNIADEVNTGYRDSTANKDAGYVFYSNQWKKENGTTDTTRNTYSHFEPSVSNEWYYYTEDAIIYADQNGTKYTGGQPSTSGTYYRAYPVYEKLETGAYRIHTHYEQISAESLAKAEASGSNWVIPKGTVFRFWDPFQETKSANNTNTHAYSDYPSIVHDDANDHYYAYDVLGNNGKLTVTPATGIRLTKTLDEAVDGAVNRFTFVLEGGSGTATVIRLDADGQETSRENVAFTDGKAEVTLAAGETVYIIGLADGVTYTITEKNHEDYRVGAVTVNGQAITGTSAQITASAQTIQSAEFVNTAKGYGDLYISKSIESDHNVPAEIAAQTFQIRVNVGAALAGQELTVKMTDMTDPTKDITTTATVTEAGNIELTLQNTQTAKILGLPEATVVTVTESLSAEQQNYFTYTVKSRDHSGAAEEADGTVTIHKDMRATVTVTNQYAPAATKLNVNFDGTKNFDAEKMTEDAVFTFRLQQHVNGAWADVDTATVTIPAGTKDASEAFNFGALELEFTEEGVYSCQILEDVGTNTDITYDRSIYTFTVVVTDNGGQLEAKIVANVESGDEANFGATQAADGSWTVSTVFNNEYHTTATDIDIVKAIVDNAGAGKTGQGFVMESHNASVTDGVWTLGSLIRSATTDAKGEVRLVRNYDNSDFADGETTKTYHFVIKERNDGLTGWIYDNTHYLVTVVLTRTVSDEGTESITADFTIHKGVAAADGTFTAGEAVVESGNAASITFTNTFDPTDVPVDLNIVPTVMKHLEGRQLVAGEFTFHIYADGDRETVLATGTNDATGDVNFDKNLTFDKVGTYAFDIVEAKGSLGGVTYDETVYDMVVVVTEENGVLKADYYFEDSTTKTATFHNSYDAAETEIIIQGTKALTGKPMLNGEFRFNLVEVTDASGTTAVSGGVTRTAANSPDDDSDRSASFAFAAIPYTTTGEFYYAITEEGAGTTVNGVTYTNKLAVVKVTVTDPGDGQLVTTSEVVTGENLTFTNTYVPLPTHADLSSSKELTGRVMMDGEFSFTLTQTESDFTTAKGYTETVQNDADGNIIFSTIHFNEAGDYYYVIEEAKGTAGGVTYDETKYQVHISVVDDHKGRLIPTTTITQVTTDDAGQKVTAEVETITFYNDYTIDGDGQLVLEGTKKLVNKTLEADAFSFGLFDSEGKLIEEVKNDAEGKFSFSALSYNETHVGQTFTYQVREILPEVGGQKVTNYQGISYDTTVYEVVVTVSDDGEGGITVSHTINGTDAPIAFTNEYSVNGHDHVVLSGTKNLTGRGIVAGEFKVGLFNGATMIAEAAIAADGSFSFGELEALTYDAADLGQTYTYTVKEIVPAEAVNNEYKGVTYDTGVFTVTVNVVDDGKGNPDASYTVNGSAFTHIVFNNTYKAEPTEHILKATKIYEKGLKGDDFTFTLEGDVNGTEIFQSKKNDKNGAITFDKIPFDAAGDYTFTVTEIDKVLGFIQYSKEVYTVVITVTDNKEGKLEVTGVKITTSTGTPSDTITFENVYILDGDAKLTLHGTKTLTGFRTQVEAGEFVFGLYDSENNLIEQVTNAADGTFRFKALEYTEADAGKTYTYTVKEIAPEGAVDYKLNGYTYDSAIYTVQVTVSDNNQGGIVVTHTVNGVDAAPISFANKYEVKDTEVNLKGTKTYDKGLQGDDFTFTLEGDIDGTKIKQEKKNAADGSIIFDTLTFTKEGTYEFTVKEIDKVLGFINYSEAEYTVVITVTDNGKGELETEIVVNTVKDGKIEFTNKYQYLDADDEVTIDGSKKLTGFRSQTKAGEFTFGLYGSDEKLIEQVTNAADGSFAFTTLKYGVEDIGTHTYTVKEIIPEGAVDNKLNGYTYDDTVFTVTVTVVDDNKGNIVATSAITGATEIVFANKYEVKDAEVNLKGTKTYDKGLQGDDFTFTLEGEIDGTKIKQEKKNDKNGAITFDTLKFAKEGKYEFTVKEKAEALGFIQYAKEVYKVQITVTDNGKGQLVATVTVNDKADGKMEFVNDYTMVDADNELTLSGTKTLVGRDLAVGEFSFGLYDESGKLLETVTNDASGKFTFSKLTYQVKENEVSTYTYTVKEIAGSDPTVTYDETVYTAVVTVKDDNKGGTELTYTVNGTNQGAIAFTNVYTEPADVAGKIFIQKSVVNKTEPGIGLKDFTFVLSDGTNAVEAKSDEKGKAGFQITFTAADIGKTYEYKVSEKKGNTAGMTYDNTVYTVTVKVSLNEDGTLGLTINDSITDSVTLNFTNTYEKPGTPVTGDSFPIMLLGIMMLLSAAGIAMVLLTKRRKSGKYSA